MDGVDLRIDPAAAAPPYEQLRAALAGRIVDGTLAVGARLPTVRALAGELGLAVNTVARAYRELEAAGVVETRGRAGTVVSAGDDSRRRVRDAARVFAVTAHGVGVGRDEALAIVAAALDDR